jgi:hypothetical protein
MSRQILVHRRPSFDYVYVQFAVGLSMAPVLSDDDEILPDFVAYTKQNVQVLNDFA